MDKRRIGQSDLHVAPFSFGCNVFGWTIDEQMSFRLLDAFVDAGFDFIDTADIYAIWHPGNKGGESETIIGRWLKTSRKRDAVVIATKVGMDMGEGRKGLAAQYIVKAVDDSLKRLQVDHIDLYQAHEDDPKTPLEETMEAFNKLVKAGKVRVLGASNYKSDRLAEALAVSEKHGFARYECLQPEYNLYDRADYEQTLEPLCVEKKLGVIPYYSLARGFLSGKYRSEADLAQSARGSGVKAYLNDRGWRILRGLDEVAKKYGSTPARVALAWLAARPSITAPIASATKPEQLQDLLESTKLSLDPGSIELLDQASEYHLAGSETKR